MQRMPVRTAEAPAAIGPYSQAIVVPFDGGRHMVFCSGQIALDPKTGAMIEGDAAAQTRRTLDNLAAVIAAAGGRLGDVVRTTIYLANMDDFAAVNAAYAERFTSAPPARSTIQAARLPRDAKVEIDAIAII
jgi:2-iminobutanoate/2-iminopropanoate deaminase